MGYLRILTAGIEPAGLEIPFGATRLGRLPDNPLCLPDVSISSRHCELTEADGKLYLQDLGSTNGTHVKGKPIEQATVAPGETFFLGAVAVRYEEAVPAPAPTPTTTAPPSAQTSATEPREGAATNSPAAAASDQPAPISKTVASEPASESAAPKFPAFPKPALPGGTMSAVPAPLAGPKKIVPPSEPPKFTLGGHHKPAPAPAAPATPIAETAPAPPSAAPAPPAGPKKIVPPSEPPKFTLGGHHKPAPTIAAPAAESALSPTPVAPAPPAGVKKIVPPSEPPKLTLGGHHKPAPAPVAPAAPAPAPETEPVSPEAKTLPPPPVALTEAAAPAPANSGKTCVKHPANPALYICPKCRIHSCDECAKGLATSKKKTVFCPVCASKMMSLADHAQLEAARQAREALTFTQQVRGVFKYPFSEGGVTMLILGGFLFFGLDLLITYGWKMRFLMLKASSSVGILALFSAGYLCAYLQKILIASAQGEDHLPGWPDFTDWRDDIIVPFRLAIAAGVASFLPAFGYMTFHVVRDSEMSLPILFPLFALGFLYFPMALLAAAMSNNWFAVNPLVVLPAITRLNLQYVLTTAVFFGLVLARFLCETLLHAVLPIPILPTLLSSLIALYFLIVEVRLLGILYHANRKRLGWFSS